ncbi:MAG: PD40 domain-containing protein [Planctomycetes bacterium]|nr:PD40 domain-containing protein [Planctomycetota bacterium]
MTTPDTPGKDDGFEPALSANGRFVAFWSFASNLVPDDSNGFGDVFVRDRKTGRTTRVSVDHTGKDASSVSLRPAISTSGRFVAFESFATDIVPGDGNASADVFLRDLKSGQSMRVSVDSAGGEGNGNSFEAAMSSSGRVVAFSSTSTNLVVGDGNGQSDVFLRDMKSGKTSRVSVDSAGIEANEGSFAPAVSSSGRFVAYSSLADNLVDGDLNAKRDVFVHDRKTQRTSRVSVDSAGLEGDGDSSEPAVSSNGRFVAFVSESTNLVAGDVNARRDVFVHDRTTGETTRVSLDSAGVEGNGHSSSPAVSSSGRFVAFVSESTNLVPGDVNAKRDVFVHDRKTGQTRRVSVDPTGTDADGHSGAPAVSAKGRFTAFESAATNLIPDDVNGVVDVFVHDAK